jgi:hypothetical protein
MCARCRFARFARQIRVEEPPIAADNPPQHVYTGDTDEYGQRTGVERMQATCFGGPFDGREVVVPDDLGIGDELQLGGVRDDGNPLAAYDLTGPGRLTFFGYHAVTGDEAAAHLESHVGQLMPILRRMDEACRRGMLIPPPIAFPGWELRRVRR